MRILEEPISITELTRIATSTFGDMVNAVVDVHRGRGVDDAAIRHGIAEIIDRLVTK
jgi:hypothetical protein